MLVCWVLRSCEISLCKVVAVSGLPLGTSFGSIVAYAALCQEELHAVFVPRGVFCRAVV